MTPLHHRSGPNWDGWILTFDFPHRITTIWHAELVSRVGHRYAIRNTPWNRPFKAAVLR